MRMTPPRALLGTPARRTNLGCAIGLAGLVIAGACRPSAPTTAPKPTETKPAAAAEAAAFLDPATDVGVAYPWSARLVRAAAVRLEHDGELTGDASNRSIDLPVTMIDEDTAGEPRRPRVLCEHAAHRIAVHYDADDLGFVARAGAVMTATPSNRSSWSEREPGVRLAAGTRLRPEGRTDGDDVRAVLESPTVRAAGFLRAEHVGLSYKPAALEGPKGNPDARVRGPASLLATPGGQELVQLRTQMAPSGIGVRRLGTEQAGYTLVALEDERMRAIGWIDTKQLEAGDVLGSITTSGRGAGSEVDGEPSVTLATGTTLHGGALQNRVGVVTTGGKFHCVSGCDGAEPVIEVAACTVSVRVVARAPTGAPPSGN